jgi:hypothetical protein
VIRVLVVLMLSAVAVAGVPRPAAAAVQMKVWNAMSPAWCLVRVTANYDLFASWCSEHSTRKWLFLPANNPYRTDDYKIVSAQGWQNECVEQPRPGEHFVWVAWCHGGSTQEWWISLSTRANVIRNASSLWCLDMSHVGSEPNGTVVAWTCNSPPSANQQWFNG